MGGGGVCIQYSVAAIATFERCFFCIGPGADIDALLVCPRNIERKDFFDSFGSLLGTLPEVKDLRVRRRGTGQGSMGPWAFICMLVCTYICICIYKHLPVCLRTRLVCMHLLYVRMVGPYVL